MNNEELIKSIQETLSIEALALIDASKNISKTFLDAIDTIYQCKGKLIITGIGKSGLIGAKMAATFASTGTPSFFLHPTEALHGDLGMMGQGDIVLAISYSGESQELSHILPHVKRFSIPLIGMTSKEESTLGQFSDVVIPIRIEKEACPLGVAPTTSTTLTLAIGDALAVALMRKRNFKKEDFANFHPGGSLGKKLFVKVSDLMQTKFLPIVSHTTKLRDAIVVMSEGRLGTLLIVNEQGQLESVLSDGDLRRALMDDFFDIDACVCRYANKNPKIITDKSMLASDALAFVEKYKIQLLVVVNDDSYIEGVLHLHQLIEAGIK